MDFRNIVRCGLIYIVIEPVGIKQLASASPADDGGTGGIVVREIVIGHMNREPLVTVPEIFFGQCVWIIFGMAGNEELPGVHAFYSKDACIPGDREQFQTGGSPYVALIDFSISGMGSLEDIVKATEERGVGFQDPVVEHAKELFRQRTLLDSIVEIETGLGTPADVERRVDMGLRPFHDFTELIPVVHLSEVQVLHWSASNDHAVITPVANLIKGSVKGGQVILVGIMRLIAGSAQQLHRYLKWCVGELAQDLGLGHDLRRHQVEDQDIQRANVLMHGPIFCHDEDILAFQCRAGGKGVWDFDGHRWDLPVMQWELQVLT